MTKNYVTKLAGVLRAAKIAHDGKSKTLDVISAGGVKTWDPNEDAGWMKYRRAMYILHEHPAITRVLKLIRYI